MVPKIERLARKNESCETTARRVLAQLVNVMDENNLEPEQCDYVLANLLLRFAPPTVTQDQADRVLELVHEITAA
jgi:hypothetical protein